MEKGAIQHFESLYGEGFADDRRQMLCSSRGNPREPPSVGNGDQRDKHHEAHEHQLHMTLDAIDRSVAMAN